MKRIIIVILTIVALAALIAAHAWLWYAIVFLFEIHALTTKWILGVALGVLAMGFLPATYVVHKRENRTTSYIYIVMATWLGTALYVAIGTAAAALALWIFPWQDHQIFVGAAALALAIAYAGYGVWNTQYPRYKRVTLPADQYPEAWRGKKIIHLSDIHLGVVHHIGFMRWVVNKVNKENPDIIFITGDLYDGVGRELGQMAAPLKEFNPPMGAYYIIGNHETYVGLDRVFAAIADLPIRTLRNENVELEGVQILGIDYHLPGKKNDERAVLDTLDPERPSIVLFHEPKPDVVEYASTKNARLFLAGHTHKGQLWPFNFITRYIYKRFHYGLSRAGNMMVYTSPGVGSWGPPMRTGNHPQIVVLTIGNK